jgi:DNA-binding transcriptional LysR family regulator
VPAPQVEFGKKQLTHEMAIAGLGVSWIPAMTARQALADTPDRVVHVDRPSIRRSVGLVTHRVVRLSAADQALRDLLRAVARDQTAGVSARSTIASKAKR